MVYIILILLLSFLTYYYDYRNNLRGRTFWIGIIGIVFILMGTLHYRVGTDTIGYEKFYNNLSPLNYLTESDISSSRFAPGFIILASFTKLFSPDMVLLNFIQSTFVCGVAIWFLKRHTQKIFFALLMFFVFCYFLLIFEQIREAIAVGIFLIACQYFEKRKWLIWYVLSYLAMMFHTSATMMLVLPLILLPGIRNLFTFGKRTFVISGMVLLLAFYLQVHFSKYIELLAVTKDMGEMTQHYADSTYVEGHLTLIGIIGFIIKKCFYAFLALICLVGNKNAKEKTSGFKLIESFAIISIYIALLSIGVPIIGRYNNYFFFFQIIIISDWIFDAIKIGNKKLRLSFPYWVIMLLPMFALHFYAYNGKLDNSGRYRQYMIYYPFTNYIDKEKDADKERAIQLARKKM